MQVITKHWTDENLRSLSKTTNALLIKKLTGVENYKGRNDQIKEIMECVTGENYADMRQRVKQLETCDKVSGSSNFGRFMELFESNDCCWIDEINKRLVNY